MFTTKNFETLSEALTHLPSLYPTNENVIQIYIKINSNFEENLNEISFRHNSPIQKSLIIVFEFNTTDTIIFWRLQDTEFYILKLRDDINGILSLFCGNFIANELKAKNLGLLDGFEGNCSVEMRNIGNKMGQNLIIAAINQKEREVVAELVKRDFDIDYKDYENLAAIDHACIKYKREKQSNQDCIKSGDIILTLLEANSTYFLKKDHEIKFTYDDLPQKVIDFTTKNELLHDYLGSRQLDFLEDALERAPNLCHFYNKNNESLMIKAIENYDREAYELLVSNGISTGRHEEINDIFEQFKDKQRFASKATEVRLINQNHSRELPQTHIFIVISKIRVINNFGRRHHEWTKYIMDTLQIFDKNEKCSKILKVVALCKNLIIFLDFNHNTINFIDPRASSFTYGAATNTEIIRIGAQNLFDDRNKNFVIGVLIHEFCHIAVLKTFMNNFDPYSIGDQIMKDAFIAAVEECKKHQKSENLVENVLTSYSESEQHSEFIVTVVQMIMEYYGYEIQKSAIEPEFLSLLMDDGEETVPVITHLINVFPLLFNYFDNIVEPELDKVLKPLKILEDKSAEIKFKDLTKPMKAKLLHQKVDFQGASTTLYDVIGDDEDICKHLTSKNIRDLLSKKTIFFDTIKVTKPQESIERRFIVNDINSTSNHVEPSNLDDYKPLKTIVMDVNHEGVILLADNAFSGKTTAFIDIAKKLKEDNKSYLVLLICLDKVQDALSGGQRKANPNDDILQISQIEEILLDIFKLQSKFEIQIFKKLFQDNKVIFLFDGLDKLCPELRKFFIKIVETLKTKAPPMIQQWISSRLTTSIKNDQLVQNTFRKVYKLAPYSLEERAKYLHSTIIDENKKKLEGLVLHFWFLDTIQCDQNNNQQDSMINSFLELYGRQQVKESPELLNFYEVFLDLYIQQKNKYKKMDETEYLDPAKMSFERVMQINALYSKFGEDSMEFAALKNWGGRKLKSSKNSWTQCTIEPYGFLNFVESSATSRVNFWNFLDTVYVEFFVAYFLIKILYAEKESIVPKEAKRVVKLLEKMCESIDKCDIIQKVILGYIKTKLNLKLDHDDNFGLNDEVREEIIQNISSINSSIINSNYSAEALKFWSTILRSDPDILIKLWEPNNPSQTILSNVSQCSFNLVKILEIVIFSFGNDWHCKFEVINGETDTDQQLENGTECRMFLKHIRDILEPYKNEYINNNYLPNKTVLTKIRDEIIIYCERKCHETFKNNQNISKEIYKKIIDCTKNSKSQIYFCENFNDKKNIFSWKVLFGTKYFQNEILSMELF